MSSARDIKKARSKNRAMISNLQRKQKALLPSIAKQRARLTGGSKPKGGGGDMENVGKEAVSLFSKLGALMVTMGIGVDAAQAQGPDQEDESRRFAHSTFGG